MIGQREKMVGTRTSKFHVLRSVAPPSASPEPSGEGGKLGGLAEGNFTFRTPITTGTGSHPLIDVRDQLSCSVADISEEV